MGKNGGDRRGLEFKNTYNHKKGQTIAFVKGKNNMQNPSPK